jgi:hypothetical protein
MGNIGFLKRALPFLGTFALGLFVASFFVSISPRFEHHERGRWHQEMWRLNDENQQLREENQRLRETIGSMGGSDATPSGESEDLYIPPSVEEPVLPPAPLKPHKVHIR